MRQNGASAHGSGSSSGHAPGGSSELHLRDFVNLVRRNVWLILAVAVLIIGVTAWVTWHTPEVYQARATIHVDQDRQESPELDFLSNMLHGSDVETEMALLRARSIADSTVDSLSLQVKVTQPMGRARSTLFSALSASAITEKGTFRIVQEGERYRILDAQERDVGVVAPGEAIVFNGIRMVLNPSPDTPLPAEIDITTLPQHDAVRELMDEISVARPYRDANVIAVTYEGTDPELVRDVPNTVAGVFIATRRAAKKTEARSTVAFLTDQIATYTEQLRESEEALLAFQQGQQVVNLQAEGAEQVRRLVESQSQRDQLTGELESLDDILAQIKAARAQDSTATGDQSPFRRLAAFPTFLQNQAVTDLMSSLNNLETELQDQLTRRKPTHPDVVALRRGIDQLEDQLYQLALNYRSNLQNQVTSLNDQLKKFGSQLEAIPEKSLEEARLERQKKVLEGVYTMLQNRLKEAQIAQAVEPGDVRVVDDAVLPDQPIRPRKARSMILAVLFGLVAGVGIAAGKDYMDETVHSRDELTRITNLPVLAMIPRIKGAANGNGKLGRKGKSLGERLVTRNDVGSPVSEAYRAFRTNITFLGIDEPPRVLVLTSPGPAEGKSTSAVNLAITLAQQGTKTLLVDCDLRRGIVHRVFGETSSEPGLTNVLMGTVSLDEAVREVDVGEGQLLRLLPTGTLPPNPSELVGSQHMRRLLAELQGKFDMVILDSPPLNLVTDAAVLGAEADGVILIARAGTTDKGAVRYALDQLRAVKARVSGTVLNDLDYAGRGRYYGSGSGYGYYHRYYKADKEG